MFKIDFTSWNLEFFSSINLSFASVILTIKLVIIISLLAHKVRLFSLFFNNTLSVQKWAYKFYHKITFKKQTLKWINEYESRLNKYWMFKGKFFYIFFTQPDIKVTKYSNELAWKFVLHLLQ